MVDYDSAVAAVQDPDADPVFLAKIAYENPEFGANVAAHERAYPGLLRWIAEFGDERAKETARERGFVATNPYGQAASEQVRDEPQQAQPAYEEPAAAEPQQPAVQPQAQAQQPVQQVAEQPVATNQYGFTVAQALDPNTDLMTIAQIAQYAPELRVYIAQNPSTYPELLNWLASLGDPAINAALAQRG
ncbi:hypothetical protein GFD17_08315 [Bifidobacterium sp. SMB2]|uniref:Leucine rich repeat variant domain-containing protein n=1 Tax=Bifidobacterium saimiriisciurei TaxID=2661627 RepID=A0ABX0CDQ0_9BIFI|nr:MULTISPECIES: hypothetical protein [Bifidobacterium]NEG96755.1 hypothetical protein [Bifidobacterium sp. SMB2]NEH12321.1 hypothetical protein [Bifidobacterium saimiriisciurei]